MFRFNIKLLHLIHQTLVQDQRCGRSLDKTSPDETQLLQHHQHLFQNAKPAVVSFIHGGRCCTKVMSMDVMQVVAVNELL
ncbi:hypothetical protein INR49_004156 [Caranx melampygus]|nr:hypothetical protein INR49_004156 [Caranx melampygus]